MLSWIFVRPTYRKQWRVDDLQIRGGGGHPDPEVRGGGGGGGGGPPRLLLGSATRKCLAGIKIYIKVKEGSK